MAETKNKVKNNLIKRISSLSNDKLKSLEDFLTHLENEKNTREEIISFAGSLNDIDIEVFVSLTDDLQKNRATGSNRIP